MGGGGVEVGKVSINQLGVAGELDKLEAGQKEIIVICI